MERWRSAVELTDSDDSMYDSDSDSDEQSYEDSDGSDDDSESCDDSDDEDEDDSGCEYYYYGDESEVSYSEEEEVVILTRIKRTKKHRGRSKTGVKKDVIKKPLQKKITKKSSKPAVQKKITVKNSKKSAVQKKNIKKSSKPVQKKNINKNCSKPVQKKISKNSNKAPQKKNTQKKSSDRPVTFLVFDLETTGLHRIYHRIIEIAVVDIDGGGQSNFYSLVNPGRPVTNSDIHGITSIMVNRPDVPRMQGLIPNLLRFVRSRQKPRGYTIFVAHNARSFDVPFLANEFKRCSTPIPSNWLFLDTLPLAREAMKHTGLQASGRVSPQALREHYGIGLTGSAHRAMSDVHSLSEVLQRIAFDLNLSTADLVQRTFTVKDLTVAKLKKKKRE